MGDAAGVASGDCGVLFSITLNCSNNNHRSKNDLLRFFESHRTLHRNEKTCAKAPIFHLAEAVRFELTVPCDTPVFKTGALNHYATPPVTDTIHFLCTIRYAGRMKYLGIDYGTRRIGVAVSDETGTLAFPLGVVAAGAGALGEVLELARENEVGAIVMGESRNFQGEPNPVMKEVLKFTVLLEEAGCNIIFEPEFMTSVGASHQFAHTHDHKTGRPSRKEALSQEMLDSSAAALILQSYLDRNRKTS